MKLSTRRNKGKMKTTQEVVQDFFNSILEVIAKNSSKSYGLVVFKNMKNDLVKNFTFLKYMKISNSTIKIDSKINSVYASKIKNLFNTVMNILGPNILKLLIKERMDPEDIEYLNRIGVRL